jgi:hypothetical protein
MYKAGSYWTTAREFTLDPITAVSNRSKFEQWCIPQYTLKLSANAVKRCRPRCADLQLVVKIPNVAHGGIDQTGP